MNPHVIKSAHGLEREYMCGAHGWRSEWAFQSAEHAKAAIANGTLVQPCEQCMEVIRAHEGEGK